MGKKKSVLCILFMTLLIAVMCFFSTVSFVESDGFTYWNSTTRVTAKDATLGNTLTGGKHYYGGGYSAVYYPDGVISSKQYEDDLAVITDQDKRDEYVGNYLPYGALYLEKEKICGENGAVTEEFKQSFADAVEAMRARLGSLHKDGLRLDVADEYTVRIFIPQNIVAQETGTRMNMAGGSAAADLFSVLENTGTLTVYGGSSSDSANASKLLPENKRGVEITDYVKGARVRTAASGTDYIVISLTDKGKEILSNATSGVSSSSPYYLFFRVGDGDVLYFSVESQVTGNSLALSGGSLTGSRARIRAAIIDSAVDTELADLGFTVGDYYFHTASFGTNALLMIYIAFAICFVAMAAFFLVRYGKLGLAHLYSFLLFFFSMLLCGWAVPFISIGVGTVVALLMVSALLSVSNAISYEYARKEYAQGKTIATSVKQGYKRCFWHIFDIHVVLAVFGFIVYGISIPALSSFAFIFALGVCFSAVCTLGINRLAWASMMAFTNKKGDFCRFKREVLADD